MQDFESILVKAVKPIVKPLGFHAGPRCEIEANKAVTAYCLKLREPAIVEVKAVLENGDEYHAFLQVGCEEPGDLRARLTGRLVDFAVVDLNRTYTERFMACLIGCLDGPNARLDQIQHLETAAKKALGGLDLHHPCEEGRCEYYSRLIAFLHLGYAPQEAVREACLVLESELPPATQLNEKPVQGDTPSCREQRRMGFRNARTEMQQVLNRLETKP
jgi:hypothetical protein